MKAPMPRARSISTIWRVSPVKAASRYICDRRSALGIARHEEADHDHQDEKDQDQVVRTHAPVSLSGP